jgi:DNA-binding transcriptional LysR family regulator
LGRWGQGRLRIGAPVGYCQHLLPEVIRDLHHEFPKLLIRLEVAENRRLLHQLEQNQIDLIISIQPEHAPGLETTPLFEDELLLAFSAQHRWAAARTLSLEEIEREPFLLFDRSSATGHMLQEFLNEQGIKPTIRLETSSIELLKRLVELNVGVGVLPPWLFDEELTESSVIMRPLPAKALKRPWAAVHRAHRRLTWPEEKLIQLLRARTLSLRLTRKDLDPVRAPLVLGGPFQPAIAG